MHSSINGAASGSVNIATTNAYSSFQAIELERNSPIDQPRRLTDRKGRTDGRRIVASVGDSARPYSYTRRRDGNVPRRQPVGLEDDDVLVQLPPCDFARDDLLELVHLEPVEDAGRDRLDQIGGLELRVLARVAADEGGALEDDVVELAAAAVVRADRAPAVVAEARRDATPPQGRGSWVRSTGSS